jgi:hypothetical protein
VLGCSASKVSRLENARVPARPVDVQALCTAYRVPEDVTARLVALAREAKHPGWWQQFDDAVPDWFETFLGMEAVTSSILTYEIQLVPGLLQTEGYIRALFDHAGHGRAEHADRTVSVRRSRQDVLLANPGRHYWAILSEAALHRLVGGPAVMRDQLLHIADVAELPNVTVQVISNDHGAHPGMNTPFVILSFPDREDPDVVFLDYLTGALYLERPEEVCCYHRAFNQLIAAALPPRQSAALVREVGKSLD